MAPASTVVAAPAYQPGKAPYLLDDSPAGLASFSRAARLFFHAKSVKDDALKVAYVGGGLVGFPELYNWYLSSATEHEAKTYDSFWADLLKRALLRDYVWDAKGRIRWAKQGDEDYEVWSSSLRTEHLQLTDKVMSTRDFIECLLYGMDPELSTILRRGSFLRNSGFHEDDLSLVALSTSTLVFTAPLNYEKFDRSARDEWNKIAARRRSNAAQIRSLSRKTAAITVSKPSRSNGSTNSGSGATTRSNSSSAAPQTTSGGGGRPPQAYGAGEGLAQRQQRLLPVPTYQHQRRPQPEAVHGLGSGQLRHQDPAGLGEEQAHSRLGPLVDQRLNLDWIVNRRTRRHLPGRRRGGLAGIARGRLGHGRVRFPSPPTSGGSVAEKSLGDGSR